MRKSSTFSIFFMLIFLISSISSGAAYGNQIEFDYSWASKRGDSEQKTFQEKTIHFPYSASWSAAIPQTHSVLVHKNYLAIVRPSEVIVLQLATKNELHTVGFDGKCLPVIFDELLYTVNGGSLIGRNLSDGVIKSEIKIEQGDPLFLLPHQEFLVVATDTNHLLKVADNSTTEAILPEKISVCPVVTGDRIVVACNDYSVHFFDFELNEKSVSSAIGELADMIGFDGKSVVAIRKSGGSVSLSISDGKRIWSNLYPKGRNLHAVSDGSKVYLLGSDSGIVAIRPDGRTIWNNRKISPSYSGVSGRLLLVSTRDGLLHPIQTSTGQSHTLYSTPGNITAMPTILEDRAFFICGPNLIELSTSAYNKYLGFECDLDFDLLCPGKMYKRNIKIKNISDRTVVSRIYCMVKNSSVSEEFLEIKPGETRNVEIYINTNGELKLQEWGELIIDTSAYRYRLGVRYVVEQIPGDCNLDCRVDASDLIIIATCIGKRSYHHGYKAEYDFDENGIIDKLDVAILLDNFGTDRNN